MAEEQLVQEEAPERVEPPIDMTAGRIWYWVLFAATVGIPLLATVISLPLWGWWNFSWILTAAVVIIVSRFRLVSEQDFGGITALEQAALELDSGVTFVPFGCVLQTMPKDIIQYEFPEEPEKVSKRRDAEGLAPGEVRPTRVMSGGGEEKHGDDPINTRLALEVSVNVEFQLVREGFFEAWIRVPGASWDEKHAYIQRVLNDDINNELTEEFAHLSPPEVLKDIKRINARLEGELQKSLTKYGFRLLRSKMKSPDFPVGVNVQLANIAEARARRLQTETDALGEKQRLITVSEGERQKGFNEAEVIRAKAKAEGEGLAEAAKAAGMSTANYRAAQVAEKALGAGDVILGAEGISQTVGLGRFVFGKGGEKKEA